MIPPHASAGSAERYPSAYGLSAAVCQALRAAFIPRRMRCLWAAGLAAALAANPYVLNDGQSLLMSSMGIASSASLLCGTILLCLKYRFTAYVLLPAIILFNAGLYMMQMRYGLVLNLSVLSSMAETNFQEACAFCTPLPLQDPASGRVYLPGHLLEPPFPAPKSHVERTGMHLGPVRGPSAAEHSGSLLQLGTPLSLLHV